eukprot:11041648-Alexandrium_andersonii.AAC.1
MSASLVGSEMCIRDRTTKPPTPPCTSLQPTPPAPHNNGHRNFPRSPTLEVTSKARGRRLDHKVRLGIVQGPHAGLIL